jgi:prepilin-type N-terminal cleavage/methylation domain-containing protein
MKRTSGWLGARAGGFTLIELLVVMGIIGLLVGMLVPAVNYAITAGRVAATRNTISSISAGLYAFRTHWGMFPPSRNDSTRLGVTDSYTQRYGYANLALYLLGPQGNGWGAPNNKGAPFGGIATEKFGPYFEPERGADIHTVRDAFPALPSTGTSTAETLARGCILYFRYEPNIAPPSFLTGIAGCLAYDDNPAGQSTDTSQGFVNQQHFAASATYTLLSATGGTAPVRWRSDEFLLISSGPDRLFGYVTSGDFPTAATQYNNLAGFYCDDITNTSK